MTHQTGQSFWMICALHGARDAKSGPRARYTDYDQARADASDLANQQGKPFVVLGIEEVVRPGSGGQERLF